MLREFLPFAHSSRDHLTLLLTCFGAPFLVGQGVSVNPKGWDMNYENTKQRMEELVRQIEKEKDGGKFVTLVEKLVRELDSQVKPKEQRVVS
jgi:hypothetical protein